MEDQIMWVALVLSAVGAFQLFALERLTDAVREVARAIERDRGG